MPQMGIIFSFGVISHLNQGVISILQVFMLQNYPNVGLALGSDFLDNPLISKEPYIFTAWHEICGPGERFTE
jgi:hypothetical protein